MTIKTEALAALNIVELRLDQVGVMFSHREEFECIKAHLEEILDIIDEREMAVKRAVTKLGRT